MYEFYKIKLFLLCICTIIGNFEQVVGLPKTAVEQKVVPLSHIATVADGKLERNKRGLLDYLLSELFEYFDYSDEDDSEEDEKYLICRNCTIVISQSGNQENAVIRPTAAPVPMESANKVNGAAPPVSGTTVAPGTPAGTSRTFSDSPTTEAPQPAP